MLIIEAAIAKLGEENQMRQTQEELAELIVAINKYERAIKNDGCPSYIAYTRKNIKYYYMFNCFNYVNYVSLLFYFVY